MNFYDFSAKSAGGQTVELSSYKGRVILVVNVASACGFTPQYEGLQALYEKYQSQGFEILAFPCNQFGAQEKGSADEIQSFCTDRFGVTFPIFQKIEVNGEQTLPLFKFLKQQRPGLLGIEAIKWNFTKFLIDRNGQVIERFSSIATPKSIEPLIESALK